MTGEERMLLLSTRRIISTETEPCSGRALPFAFALVDALGGDSAPIRKSFLYDEMKAWPDGVKEVSGQ